MFQVRVHICDFFFFTWEKTIVPKLKMHNWDFVSWEIFLIKKNCFKIQKINIQDFVLRQKKKNIVPNFKNPYLFEFFILVCVFFVLSICSWSVLLGEWTWTIEGCLLSRIFELFHNGPFFFFSFLVFLTWAFLLRKPNCTK